jgi:hypothetical protein
MNKDTIIEKETNNTSLRSDEYIEIDKNLNNITKPKLIRSTNNTYNTSDGPVPDTIKHFLNYLNIDIKNTK